MAESQVVSEEGWGLTETVIMAAVLVGMLIPWTLFVIAPRDGLVPLYGIVISLLAGAYLVFLVFSYLRY